MSEIQTDVFIKPEYEELLKKFKESSGIKGLNAFIKYCNDNGLLLDDVENNTKIVSQKVKDSLVVNSFIDGHSFGDYD